MRRITRLENQLDRIERNQEMILRNQTIILDSLIALEKKSNEKAESPSNEWIQQGIDSIMGYQWPPAKGGNE